MMKATAISYDDFLMRKSHSVDFDGIPEERQTLPDTLFDFQRHLVSWAIQKGRCALFCDCGLGKTFMELVFADNICRSTNGKVLIVTPLAVSHQFVSEGEKFGVFCQKSSSGKPKGDITVTNYERLHLFDPEDYVGVVCDECFPPGTPIEVLNIDNSLEMKHIEDIRINDKILNANGEDYVKEIYKRSIKRAVCLGINGRELITCSENHPFFTLYGWRSAQDLQPGDYVMETKTAMRLVRGDIQAEICSHENAEILRDILLSEMENESERNKGENTHHRESREDRQKGVDLEKIIRSKSYSGNGEDKKPESDVKHRDSEKGVVYIAEDEAQTFRAWGKWDWINDPATDFAGCSWKRMDTGIWFITGPIETWISNRLQAGLSSHREKNKYRGGRTIALREEGEGSEEGHYAGFSRVESVEILEQGHPELEKFRDAEGYVYFYDLKAKRHPSFSVNGILVHNSSILKNFDGSRRKIVTEFLKKKRYRLLATATPSPNDYIELGTTSEALGELGYMDMLQRFFKNDQNTIDTKRHWIKTGGEAPKWRFKKHAQGPFWKWVCSWARAMRKPSDIGFDDGPFILPELIERQTVILNKKPRPGEMWVRPAVGLAEQRVELRETLTERCEKVAEIISGINGSSVAWCHLNDEGDLLEKIIPGAVQVSGKDSDERKEEILTAFSQGEIDVLVTKPKIASFGMNWQHCSHTTFFPSHSFEQYYQSVRRFWRFGQKNPVTVDIVTTQGGEQVLKNLQRKSKAAEEMFESLVLYMNDSVGIDKRRKFTNELTIPNWLM